jgi:penicillin amidase
LVSQPGTWYEAHIVTPEFELYGCYLAGTPFVWDITGIMLTTMFENDDIDFYREVNSPRDGNKYKTPQVLVTIQLERNYQSKRHY